MIGLTCQKPGCDSDGSNTYTGPNGNDLRLCDRHYYREVTDGGDVDPGVLTPSIHTLPGGVGFDTTTDTIDWPPEENSDSSETWELKKR